MQGIQKSGLKIAAFDMEGCLTCDPTVWEIMHRKNNSWRSCGEPYWERYRAGELGYDEFARLDVAAWRGAPAAQLRSAAAEVRLMPGCRELLRKLNQEDIYTVVISNGLMCVARRLAAECGIKEVFANRAIAEDGKLTGELQLDVPYDSKGEVLAKIMKKSGAAPKHVIAVGDSAADIPMFSLARVSIAICPENSEVGGGATHVVEEKNLAMCMDIMMNMI